MSSPAIGPAATAAQIFSAVTSEESGGGAEQQQDELLAAESIDEVVGAELLAEPVSEVLQHAVAGRVAVVVVDQLEPVQVHDDDGDRLAGEQRLMLDLADPVCQRAAIEHPGQRVDDGCAPVLDVRVAQHGRDGVDSEDGDEQQGQRERVAREHVGIGREHGAAGQQDREERAQSRCPIREAAGEARHGPAEQSHRGREHAVVHRDGQDDHGLGPHERNEHPPLRARETCREPLDRTEQHQARARGDQSHVIVAVRQRRGDHDHEQHEDHGCSRATGDGGDPGTGPARAGRGRSRKGAAPGRGACPPRSSTGADAIFSPANASPVTGIAAVRVEPIPWTWTF